MIAKTTLIAAFGLMLGAASTAAFAQDRADDQSFEVSSLRLTSLPIPTSRAEALVADQVAAKEIAPAPKIRRTADGIRMVGPVYFPEDRN